MIIQLGLHFEVFFLVSFLNRFSLYDHPLFHIYVSNILLSTMEVNAEKGVAKYSKLLEDKVKKNNDISLILAQEIKEKQKTETLAPAMIENNNCKGNVKNEQNGAKSEVNQKKVGLKTLVGLALAFMMIVAGLVAILLVMSMENQRLNKQNQNLVRDLETQKQISKNYKAQTQSLVRDIENMKSSLNVSQVEIGVLKHDCTEQIMDLFWDLKNMTISLNKSKVEIESLKQDIQNLIIHNQKLTNDFESKHQLHQNCSQEQKLSKDLIEDLKLQNQKLTIDLEKIDSAKKFVEDIIPDETKNQLLFDASKNSYFILN